IATNSSPSVNFLGNWSYFCSGFAGFPLECSATIVSREWVLDSVACYQRQPFDEYIEPPSLPHRHTMS
uniref:BRCT domain-containing protein n=1 Tax=Varanus komodoensis TaxID=61221 RepID=A0A8D2LM07_VARKO